MICSDLLSVGERASVFREEVHEGVYITAFFENKPKAAMEDGLKCWKATKAFGNDVINVYLMIHKGSNGQY